MNLKRVVYRNLIEDVSRREIGIIIGPRQVGKTTLLEKIEAYHRKKELKCRYFNLEMPKDANYFARDFEDILDDLCKDRQSVLIDEFHYLPNATKLFKSIYDGCKGIKVLLTQMKTFL